MKILKEKPISSDGRIMTLYKECLKTDKYFRIALLEYLFTKEEILSNLAGRMSENVNIFTLLLNIKNSNNDNIDRISNMLNAISKIVTEVYKNTK